MTKRAHKSRAPTGPNQSLGKSLVNRSKTPQNFQNKKNKAESNCLESRTHETDLQEFIFNAELANKNFEAERKEFKLVESGTVIEQFENRSLSQLNAEYGHLLKIPRRPKSGSYCNADELNTLETSEFLEWRRQLAKLTEGYGLILTPFERNLEIWRQLWRVVERSHVVVQIVDARNPLFFRNIDLEKFVQEVDSRKKNLLLINKADLLSSEQIKCWQEYFTSKEIEAIFWSAIDSEDFIKQSKLKKQNWSKDEKGTDERISRNNIQQEEKNTIVENHDNILYEVLTNNQCVENIETDSLPTFIYSTSELLALFHRYAAEAFPKLDGNNIIDIDRKFVIGMVGYPNVGKSSTINKLLGIKKTSVSATPGKTKHFQTLIINDQITLCDCPGLVMPSFGLSTSEMLINGILPIAHMRDHFSPIQLICNRLSRQVLQQRYSVLLPKIQQPDVDVPVNAHDLLTTLAFLKGYMSSSGIPDCSRAARLILADFVNGTLRWSAAPPGFEQQQFDKWTFSCLLKSSAYHRALQRNKQKPEIGANLLEQLKRRELLLEDSFGNKNSINIGSNSAIASFIDKEFFTTLEQYTTGNEMAHVIGQIRLTNSNDRIPTNTKKHFNNNKREKLRRRVATTQVYQI